MPRDELESRREIACSSALASSLKVNNIYFRHFYHEDCINSSLDWDERLSWTGFLVWRARWQGNDRAIAFLRQPT